MTETRRVAIVMSRMPRLIDPHATWLGGLRACLRRIKQRGDTLLVAPETAGADFVFRGAQRLRIVVQQVASNASPEEPSLRDQHLIDRAHEVFVLGLRKDGNVHRLLNARLETGRREVSLVDLPELQPAPVREQLLAAGASSWTPNADDLRPLMLQDSRSNPDDASTGNEIVSLAAHHHSHDEFLTHTTRACPGPWPRQPVEEYLDRLLDSCPDGHHSALMTLTRIVRHRLLIASNRTIRGGFSVVSFTAVPFAQLPELRTFRTHRSHWDFEPYGLSIRRSALAQHHIQSVRYGTEERWQELTEAERPFFQLSREQATESQSSATLDWTVEQEWRHLGDLDLTNFTDEDIIVFVPTYAEARLLQPYCPWPVTLWPGSVE